MMTPKISKEGPILPHHLLNLKGKRGFNHQKKIFHFLIWLLQPQWLSHFRRQKIPTFHPKSSLFAYHFKNDGKAASLQSFDEIHMISDFNYLLRAYKYE